MQLRAAFFFGFALAFLATSASAEDRSFVGKFTSGFTSPVSGTLPASSFVTVASAPLPQKYSSKKHFLTITTMVQENCALDLIASTLSIGGVGAEPDPGMLNYRECDQSGWEMHTRTWQFVPEALGGPAIAAGSTIDLKLYAPSGAQYNLVTIHAVATK